MSWTTPSAAGNDGPGAVQHALVAAEEDWTDEHEEGLMDMLGIGSDAFAGPIEDTSDGVEWSNAPPPPELKATSGTAATLHATQPAADENVDEPALWLAAPQDPCLPTTAAAADVAVYAGCGDQVTYADGAAWEQARRVRDVLSARTVAILSEVPAEVCAMLAQAEGECLRFFALPGAVKRQCTAPSIAAATAGAGAGTAGGGSGDGRTVSGSHAEALAGGGYREHGPEWREQYHVVVGGAELATALRGAQRWYEALCLAVSDLLCPGLADRLRREARARSGDDPSVLDGFYYPNRARGTADPNMSAHYDPGYVTVTAASTTPGLDVLVRGNDAHEGGWLDVEAHADAGTEIVLFLSESMRRAVATAADAWREQHASESESGNGSTPPPVLECAAANHRVHRDTSEGAVARSSLVYELRSHYTGV
eukprot:g3605.t1